MNSILRGVVDAGRAMVRSADDAIAGGIRRTEGAVTRDALEAAPGASLRRPTAGALDPATVLRDPAGSLRVAPDTPLSPAHRAVADRLAALEAQQAALPFTQRASMTPAIEAARTELAVHVTRQAVDRAEAVLRAATGQTLTPRNQLALHRGVAQAYEEHARALTAAGRESEAVAMRAQAGAAWGRSAFMDLGGSSGRAWTDDLNNAIRLLGSAGDGRAIAALLSRANVGSTGPAVGLMHRAASVASYTERDNMLRAARSLIDDQNTRPFTLATETPARTLAPRGPLTDAEWSRIQARARDPNALGTDVEAWIRTRGYENR